MNISAEEYMSLGFDGGNDGEFDNAMNRAKNVINIITDNALEKILSPAQTARLKLAVCAQAENYLMGNKEYINGEKVVIGDYTFDGSSAYENELVCNMAVSILRLSGMLCCGVETV